MLGVKKIEQIIPHRHPFLLVDYIEELEPGVRGVGYKCVTFHEDFFKGHFPQEPVMPGCTHFGSIGAGWSGSNIKFGEQQRESCLFWRN